MELVLLSAQGLAADSVLSIRVGQVRKQAALHAVNRPIRFPSAPEDWGVMQVEVLRTVGRALGVCSGSRSQALELRLEPSPHGCCDADPPATAASLSFRVQPAGKAGSQEEGGPLSPSDERQQLLADTDRYLERHRVLAAIQEGLQRVMRDRPENPVAFLARHLAARAQEAEAKDGPGASEERRPTPTGPAMGHPASASSGRGSDDCDEATGCGVGALKARVRQLFSDGAASGELARALRSAGSSGAAQHGAVQGGAGVAAADQPPRCAGAARERRPTVAPADEKQRLQSRLDRQAFEIRIGALEKASLLADLGRMQALIEMANTQNARRPRDIGQSAPVEAVSPPSAVQGGGPP